MSEIQRFRFEKTITARNLPWEFLNEATDGEWVKYIDHRAEVERVIADVVKLRIDLNSVQVEASQLRGEAERLIAERDKIHAEVQRLTQILNGRRATDERVTAKLDEARADVKWLKEQVAALTVAVEQADEAKADAEAAAAREEAETDRVMVERDAAQAEVERLKNTLYPWDTYYRLKKANEHLEEDVAKLTVDRDAAQAEVERLKRMLPPTAHTGVRNGPGEGSWSVFAGKVVEERDEAREEVERLNAEVKRLTTERDEARAERDAEQRERERVQALLRLRGRELAEYRKRWPR